MIAKAIKGKGFRGALDYDLSKAGALMLDTNMAGKTARELAQEFGAVRKLRPTLGKAVLHVSLSATPGEKLTDEQWREIGKRYIDGMDLDQSQYCVIKHSDTEHEHVHIIANRIRFDGTVVSDSHDYKRQEQIMREIERDFRLQRVAPSIEAERKAPSKGEIELAVRTGESSIKQRLQQICDSAAKDCKSYTEYQERLEAIGVEVVPVTQSAGAKLNGLSYRLDGVTMKGSDLGKSYSAAGVQKRGINYEQDRDFAAVSRSNQRDAHRAFGLPDRDLEAGATREHRELGRGDRADGAGHGSAGRRVEADAQRDGSQEQRAGRGQQEADHRGHESGRAGIGAGPAGRREPEPRQQQHGLAALRPGAPIGAPLSGARERIVALASPCAKGAGADRDGRAGRDPAAHDRSAQAIERQIAAFGTERFEVGIRDAKTGQMMNKNWGRGELERSLPWLKRMNAQGNDLYIRPAGEHGLVLLDDLKKETLEQLKADGLAPAAVIETSPGNYQSWIKLSDRPIGPDGRREVARDLAQRYGADMASADSRHYGRLAGFTNCKPKHTRHDGRQPYVLAHDCPGAVAPGATPYLREIADRMDKQAAQQEREKRLGALEVAKPGVGGRDPIREYQRQAQRLLQRYGKGTADLSKLDWMIATDMAKAGYPAQGIERALLECSPNLDSRKAGHIEDYARRTTEAAWAHTQPEREQRQRVQQQQQRAERAAERDRDRGMGMGM